MLNTAHAQKLNNSYQGYVQNPIEQVEAPVIEGYFYKESTVKDMAIRKVNKSLCGLLILAIITSVISYYFVICNVVTLDTLNRKIVALNEENAELQNSLDSLKSFSNVDTKMVQYNLLHKAENVIEVSAVQAVATVDTNHISSAPFKWAIGY